MDELLHAEHFQHGLNETELQTHGLAKIAAEHVATEIEEFKYQLLQDRGRNPKSATLCGGGGAKRSLWRDLVGRTSRSVRMRVDSSGAAGSQQRSIDRVTS